VRDDGRVISWQGDVLRLADFEYEAKRDEERMFGAF
jgi:hypothetical protein